MRPDLTIFFGALLLLSTGCSAGNPAIPSVGDDAGPTVGDAGGPPTSSGLPCDVDAVLAESCRSCHASTPLYGAPMPLMTYADTQAPAKSDPTKKVFEMMRTRVNAATAQMPPTGPLDAAPKKTLDDWFAASAPPAAEGTTCAPTGGDAGGPAVGPRALPCTPTQTFTAHAQGGAAPYHVPDNAGNLYECFTFKSPFNGTTQGTAWAPITGDARVLHHWILYKTSTAQTDGAVGPCNMPSDATFVAGWAPGGTNYVLPNDVGLELAGPNDSFILQVHYHNIAGYTDANDASGVALCTTDTPRAHEAGVVTLGTVHIDVPPHATGYTTAGTCPSWITKYVAQPVNVIATFPHMHGLGRKMTAVVHRGADDGPAVTLDDVESFSFDNQHYYPHAPAFVFNPGDSITTTCTYDNAGDQNVMFGERTEDEMCFDFVLLYPITLFQPQNRSCGLF